MRFLADDSLEGRDTGSAGYRKAAEYVASGFKAAGLEPAGTAGFFQPIAFDSRQFVEDQSRLALVRDGNEQPLVFGDSVIVSGRLRLRTHEGLSDNSMHWVHRLRDGQIVFTASYPSLRQAMDAVGLG